MAVTPPVVATTAVTAFTSQPDDPDYALTIPTGITVGDYLIAYLRNQSPSYSAEAGITGFTRLTSGDLGSPTNRYQAIFGKRIATSGDIPTSLTLSQPGSPSGTRWVVIVARITGVHPTDPIVGVTTSLGTVTGGTITRSAFNATDQALDLVCAGSEFAGGNEHTPTAFPAGYTTVAQVTRPISGDTAASRTYGYMGRRVSSGPIADDASITWATPSGPAIMGVTLRGQGIDGGGGGDTRLTPHVVGAPTFATIAGGAAAFTIPVPVGVRAGDVLLIGYRTNGTNSPDDFTCPGWTRRGTAFAPYNSEQRVVGLHVHPVTDTRLEPATYTFVKTVSDTRTVAAMVIIRDADLTDLVVGESETWATASPSVTISSFPILHAPALLIALFANEETAGYPTLPTSIPAGFTTVVSQNQLRAPASLTGTRTSIWLGTRPVDEAGMSGQIVAQWGVNSGNGNSALALRGRAAPDPVDGLPVLLPDGRQAGASIIIDGHRAALGSLTGFRRTYPPVDAVLAVEGVTIAHRGGSTTWPEMSAYAYAQASARGYQVLEFSAQRSSDGWWFGMHDNNFDRTSWVTDSLPPSFYTRSQIELSFENRHNAATPRPYWGLVDFLNRYSNDHILLADPKNALGHQAEFLDILDAHGGPARIIVKYFGVGSGSVALADAASDRGYQTWGYYYESDVDNGDLAASQAHWSILGMEWSASPAAWAAALSYGKPVIGHICATQEQVNTAMLRGARWVQCSGVDVIDAVRL